MPKLLTHNHYLARHPNEEAMTNTPTSDIPDAATASKQTPADASLYERLGGTYGISGPTPRNRWRSSSRRTI